MKIFLNICLAFSILIITFASDSNPVSAKVKSVSQVKGNLRELIDVTQQSSCFGACQVTRRLDVCSTIENLDQHLNGKIIDKKIVRKLPNLAISKSDLSLMKLIYSQCQVVKVEDLPPYIKIKPGKVYKSFDASCSSIQKIRKGLNLHQSADANC